MNYYFKCPKCKQNEKFRKVSEQPSGFVALLLLGGRFLTAGLLAISRAGRVQCGTCGYIFYQPGFPIERVYLFAGRVLILLALGVILTLSMLFVSFSPDLRNQPALDLAANYVANYPYAVLLGLGGSLILVVIYTVFTMMVSSIRGRRRTRVKYLVTADPPGTDFNAEHPQEEPFDEWQDEPLKTPAP